MFNYIHFKRIGLYTLYSVTTLALEPQGWPNAANEGAFPSVVLHPKDVYSQHTRFAFDMNAV